MENREEMKLSTPHPTGSLAAAAWTRFRGSAQEVCASLRTLPLRPEGRALRWELCPSRAPSPRPLPACGPITLLLSPVPTLPFLSELPCWPRPLSRGRAISWKILGEIPEKT